MVELNTLINLFLLYQTQEVDQAVDSVTQISNRQISAKQKLHIQDDDQNIQN